MKITPYAINIGTCIKIRYMDAAENGWCKMACLKKDYFDE
jgi:hypothetical protein